MEELAEDILFRTIRPAQLADEVVGQPEIAPTDRCCNQPISHVIRISTGTNPHSAHLALSQIEAIHQQFTAFGGVRGSQPGRRCPLPLSLGLVELHLRSLRGSI